MNKKDEKTVENMIRSKRKFSLAAGLSDQAAGIFEGASSVPLVLKLKTEMKQFIRANVSDSSGALKRVLEQLLDDNEPLVVSHSKKPLEALQKIITTILSDDDRLYEFVRRVDQQYGKMYQERPYFQRPGQEPHQDDEYTHASVRLVLEEVICKLNSSDKVVD